MTTSEDPELQELRHTLCGFERKHERNARKAWIGFALFVILAMIVAAVALMNQKLDEVEERQRTLAHCLLLELTAHRIDSRFHHQLSSEVHMYPYPPSGVPLPQQLIVDPEACNEFLEPGSTK